MTEARSRHLLSSSWVRTTEPLMWLAGAGHEVRGSRAYFYDARLRKDAPHVTLQMTISGAGFYENRRGRWRLPAGSAFIDVIPGPFKYGYPPEEREPYELVFASITGPVADRWHRRIVKSFGNVLTFGPQNEITPQMLALAHGAERRSLGDRYAVSGQLYQLVMTMLGALNRSRAGTERMGNVLTLLERHAADVSFNVTSLAHRMDCSREYLARQFRTATGVSPSDYLTQHRLRLVARALRSGDDKLDAVARHCGFSGANYLCRVFREHYGVTPSQFRARPWLITP